MFQRWTRMRFRHGGAGRWILPTAGLVLLAGVAWACPRPVPTSAAPLPHGAYVWQRRWTPELEAALAAQAPTFDRLEVLAAEMDRDGKVTATGADWAWLAHPSGHGARVVVVFRADAALLRHPQWWPGWVRDIRRRIEAAQAEGLEAAAVQLDVDSPESKLGDYAALLRQVKAGLPGARLEITALPCWLDRRALPEVLAACDGWTLQVHSLSKPDLGTTGDDYCPVAKVRNWVEDAARLSARTRRPFRVALPCCGMVLFEEQATGRRRLHGEDAPPVPEGCRANVILPDADALAGLVADWSRAHPAALAGISWFRLPVPGDRLAWPPETLAAVRAGRTPRGSVRLACEPAGSGVWDLFLEGVGERDSSVDALRLDGAGMAASDFFAGEPVRQADAIEVRAVDGAWRVFPGRRLRLGWWRGTREPELLEVHHAR